MERIWMEVTQGVEIRPMRADDFAGCRIVAAESFGKLYGQLSEPELREAFSSSSYRPTFYVAQANGQVVGMAGYVTSLLAYGVYNLCWVGVRRAFRGQRIGHALVDKCMADLGPIADAVMLVTAIPDFYLPWGFERVCSIPQTSGEGDVLMIRRYA